MAAIHLSWLLSVAVSVTMIPSYNHLMNAKVDDTLNAITFQSESL
jgi:hypothetical protein